jgi:putative tricarboxylic transport membrane protein
MQKGIRMFSNQNLLAGLALLIFGALTLGVLIPYGVQQPPSVQYQALSPSYWPNIVAVAICTIGLALTIGAAITGGSETAEAKEPGSIWLALRPFVALVICFALYFGLEPLGFVLTCTIALAALMLLAGEYRPHIIVPVALIVPLSLHLFFTKAASVPIPMGVLEPWLLRI